MMTQYSKNYKGVKYSISQKFILDMENNHEIDMIKEMEQIIDDCLEAKEEDD